MQTGQLVFGTLSAAFAVVGVISAPTKAIIDVTIVNLFYENSFAVLGYDAFEPNGISKNMKSSVTNSQRQEMIFAATVGAIEWALKQKDIDNKKIYLYGISNGATVVVNLAAMYDKKKIKAVFSEAPAHAGMGMPDDIQVPLVLVQLALIVAMHRRRVETI